MPPESHKPNTTKAAPAAPTKGSRQRVDALMEEASKALIHRRYFEAERLALQALRKAHALLDYDRMARILLPLQEARRQKRDMAIDACAPAMQSNAGVRKASKGAPRAGGSSKKKVDKVGASTSGREAPALQGVFVIDHELPAPKALRPGCYLIAPPRVGVDGRALRELADQREVPIVVTVREPTTQTGLWPVVAVGPVTLRAKVSPPPSSAVVTVHSASAPAAAVPTRTKKTSKRSAAGAGKAGGSGKVRAAGSTEALAAGASLAVPPPPPEWFLVANEALGDAAIAAIPETANARQRVEALLERLEALPDHEKLHQALAEAAREAAKQAKK